MGYCLHFDLSYKSSFMINFTADNLLQFLFVYLHCTRHQIVSLTSHSKSDSFIMWLLKFLLPYCQELYTSFQIFFSYCFRHIYYCTLLKYLIHFTSRLKFLFISILTNLLLVSIRFVHSHSDSLLFTTPYELYTLLILIFRSKSKILRNIMSNPLFF